MSEAAPRAADLPVGSIVATAVSAWIKVSVAAPDLGTWLAAGDELSTYDWEPQSALDDGGQVLRVGDGSER